MRAFDLGWKKKTPAQKAEAAMAKAAQEREAEAAKKVRDEQAAVAASRRDGGKTLGEFAQKVRGGIAKERAAVAASRRDGGETLGGIAQKGKDALAKERAKQQAHDDYAGGIAGTRPLITEEALKPVVAGTVAGGVGLGTYLGHAAQGAPQALGGLLLADSLMGLNNARKMRNDAQEFDDAGMANLAGRKAKDQMHGLVGASVLTARAGVGIAGKVGLSAGSAALATGGAAMGVVSGGAMVLQGAWRGGKAVMKLCRLAWGRAKTMLSERGANWKKAITSSEKYKAAINALKMTLGAAGIAAGTLLLMSNPVGWGLGIAAAIAGGAYAGVKIAGKLKNAWDRGKAAERIQRGESPEQIFGDLVEPRGAEDEDDARVRTGKNGFNNKKAGRKSLRATKRSEAIKQANELARLASGHAAVADELRGALRAGNKIKVQGVIEAAETSADFNKDKALPDLADRELHDSFLLLSSINVDPDEALSESGQELIEKKLSKTEAM
jgi:hypothetical protein